MLFLMGWKAELWDNQTSPFVRCLEISRCLIFIGYTSAEVLKKVLRHNAAVKITEGQLMDHLKILLSEIYQKISPIFQRFLLHHGHCPYYETELIASQD